MSRSRVLCDPGLLIAPDSGDADAGLRFWPRLIGWAADRRIMLGPATVQLVCSAYAEIGWPTFDPPACPAGLKRTARHALHTLLAQVPSNPGAPQTTSPRTVRPAYLGPSGGDEAISQDAEVLHTRGLIGLATLEIHWAEPADAVSFDPPPPASLPFAIEPHQRLPGEVDHAVATHLQGRRITIVGGEPSQSALATLVEQFDLSSPQLRWIGSEKGQRLNLDPLDGLQAGVDIVYCITGHIGHSGREGDAETLPQARSGDASRPKCGRCCGPSAGVSRRRANCSRRRRRCLRRRTDELLVASYQAGFGSCRLQY